MTRGTGRNCRVSARCHGRDNGGQRDPDRRIREWRGDFVPQLVEVSEHDPEEVRHTSLEIRRSPNCNW